MEIPRCRENVSEDTGGQSTGSEFSSENIPGRTPPASGLTRALTRKPGDRREPSSITLSRAKEDGLRSQILFLLFAFVSAALAADLHIRVVDPQSAAVAGAQVSLYREGESSPVQVRTTSGNGEAVFHVETESELRAQVLAPGFAEAWATLERSASAVTVIRLQVAAAAETVVVTATRTLVPQQETTNSVSTLSSGEIETMQPASFADALRFMPGAVVNVAGQHGGLGS